MSSMSGSRGMGTNTGRPDPRGDKLAGYNVKRVANYTPEQMQLLEQSMQNVGPDSYTSRLARGDEGLFNEMEAPAFRQFNALQGNIASRFSGGGGGAGSLGSRRSSGFQNTLSQAGSDFAQDLQSRRQELMRGAIRDLHGMSSDLLDKRPYENYLEEKKKPWWHSAVEGGLPIVGGIVGGVATGGNPAGIAAGAKAGGAAARGFTGR